MISAFFIVPCILFLPSLILLNIQFRSLSNPRLVGIRTSHAVLVVNQLRPRVLPAAPKTLLSEGRSLSLRGLVGTVRSDSPLGHTCIRIALGDVLFFATALLYPNDIPDVVQVVLCLEKSVQHVNESRPLLQSGSCVGLPIQRVVSAETFLKRWVDVILEYPPPI